MKILDGVKLDFNDVLLVPRSGNVASRSEVTLIKTLVTPHSGARLKTSGIIAANMDGVGTFEAAKVLLEYGVMTAITKHYSVDELVEFFTSCDSELSFYSMGISDADYDKLEQVKERATIDLICIDVANGYMDAFHEFVSRIRLENPLAVIMAGNVVTADATLSLYHAGADIVKVGIGPGAMCTTRVVTGVGYPQLSAVMDIVDIADEHGILICSDGGCSTPGHVSIAMAAGADMVMLGTMLAGTTEGGGNVVEGKVQFYGMSSKTANEKHSGGLKNYRSSEGRTTEIPFKGGMRETIEHINGGLRSTCAYIGVSSLEFLPMFSTAVRVNRTHNTSFAQVTSGN